MVKVYMAHPISGLTGKEVLEYFEDTRSELTHLGCDWVLSPMTAKGYFRNEITYKAHGYEGLPVSTNHAIYERDRWMISRANLLFCDLTGADHVSIGCMFELAWAADNGLHTVVIMEADNVHRHAFVLEAADIVFETKQEAMDYIEKLSFGDMT